jgi:hypothetical protein
MKRNPKETIIQFALPTIVVIVVYLVIIVIRKYYTEDSKLFKSLGESFILESLLPLLTGNIMFFPAKQIVSEREDGLENYLKLMGVSSSSNLVAVWLIQ